MEDSTHEQIHAQEQLNRSQVAEHMAAKQASHRAQETVKNPGFHAEIADADVDSDLYTWISEEFGPVFSKAHIHGNRHQRYGDQQWLLNMNLADRYIAERSPGRILREHPKMLALAQGIRGTKEYPDPTDNPKFREPIREDEKRVVREAMEVATNQQALSEDAEGFRGVTTAIHESRTVSQEHEEQGRISKRLGALFS